MATSRLIITSHSSLLSHRWALKKMSGEPVKVALLASSQPLSNNNGHSFCRRFYFTNGDRMKEDDPYAQLGLQWGDAATTAEIKEAFRQKARELHPDVNKMDTPEQALRKFQKLQKAYQTLLGNVEDAEEGMEQWRFAVWRTGDRIAQDRTDVAGVARKRPAQPASKADLWSSMQIGHPDGRGVVSHKRGEFLGTGKTPSSSVGRGLNKWVNPKKEYKPWDPEAVKSIRASNFAAQSQPSHQQSQQERHKSS